MYNPRHVQRKVGGSSGSEKSERKKVNELTTKKRGEEKWKVHTEIQQRKNKKQASKQLKYIKPLILCLLTCDLTLRKSPLTPFVFKGSLKKKPTISINKPTDF
jgi:hypothetical protein